jgi:hypothetical protein
VSAFQRTAWGARVPLVGRNRHRLSSGSTALLAGPVALRQLSTVARTLMFARLNRASLRRPSRRIVQRQTGTRIKTRTEERNR